MIYVFVMIYSTAYCYMVNVRAGRVGFFIAYSPVFLLLLLALSLQDGVGTDYYAYLSMAAGEKELGWIENKNEILFVWLNDLVVWLGEPQLIFFFAAFIQLSFLALIAYELKLLGLKLYWFFLLYFIFLLVFFNSFNGVRQYIAVYIAIYSFFWLYENAKIRFVALLGMAAMIHSSAIYLLPFVLISNLLKARVAFNVVLASLVGVLLVGVLSGDSFVRYLIQFTGYSEYLKSDYLGGLKLFNIVTKFPKIFLVIFCSYVLETRYRLLADKFRFFLNLSYLSLLVLALSFSTTLIWRLYQYFDFFTIFPVLILLSCSVKKQLLCLLVFLLLLVYLMKVTFLAKGEYLYNSIVF